MVGNKIGKYHKEREIASGGTARVFEARRRTRGFDKVFAIKILKAALRRDPDTRDRFLEEARILADIDHPNIVKVFDFDQDRMAGPYMVMELLDGDRLDSLIRRSPLEEKEAIRVAAMVLDALDEVHRRNLVHRDVKPSNVQVTSRGRAVLIDFGIAKGQANLTRVREYIGTPAYASPEQNNMETADGRSDIYSLGVILFEMISGRQPFPGEDPFAVRKRQIEGPPPLLDEATPAVREIVARAMAPEPGNRFPSPSAMRTALLELNPEAAAAPRREEEPVPKAVETIQSSSPPDDAPTHSGGEWAEPPARKPRWREPGPAPAKEAVATAIGRKALDRDLDRSRAAMVTFAVFFASLLVFLVFFLIFRRTLA